MPFFHYLRGDWRLDQCFTLATGPFATHMLLNDEHIRCVIQLLADMFANTLKLAATSARGALGLVANNGTGKLKWQRCTLGLLARRCRRWLWAKRFQLRFNGFQVSIEQVIEQVALRRADLLAPFGEPEPFVHSNFVSELFDQVFFTLDFFAHRTDLLVKLGSLLPERINLRQQLRSCSGVK